MSERHAWFFRDQLRKTKPPTWATIIPTRTTKSVVVMHNTEAHAKNAISVSFPKPYSGYAYDRSRGGHPVAEGEIHEFVDGEWTLRWEVPDGTYPNELPWK